MPPEYERDSAYLGPGLAADISRRDLIRSALSSYLEAAGLHPLYEVNDATLGSAEEPLLMSVSIRRFYARRHEHELESMVALECRISKMKSQALLWQGSSEGSGWRIFQAVDSALEQCVNPAVNFLQRRQKLAWAKRLQQIKSKETAGDGSEALNLYGEA